MSCKADWKAQLQLRVISVICSDNKQNIGKQVFWKMYSSYTNAITRNMSPGLKLTVKYALAPSPNHTYLLSVPFLGVENGLCP